MAVKGGKHGIGVGGIRRLPLLLWLGRRVEETMVLATAIAVGEVEEEVVIRRHRCHRLLVLAQT